MKPDKTLNLTDPLERQQDHGLDNLQGCTPFDPPSAKEQAIVDDVAQLDFPVIISQLFEEHKFALSNTEMFEQALVQFRENNYTHTDQSNQVFAHFFRYFDAHLMAHNEKEDKVLFPILEKYLLKHGEHSTAEIPTTAIDIMQDDHIRFIQLGALSFNLFGLATRLRDEAPRIFVHEQAYHAARELIELLKLHIYREDHTLFPLALKYISQTEFDEMELQSRRFVTSNY